MVLVTFQPSRRQSLYIQERNISGNSARKSYFRCVERGRVNNAMNQLKRVEDERAKMEL